MCRMKKCTGCGKDFPSTKEYFHVQSQKVCGLRPKCKLCHAEDNKKYKEDNRLREERKRRQAGILPKTKLSEEEAKRRQKESHKKSKARPEYKAWKNQYEKERKNKDATYKFLTIVRSRISVSLKRTKKSASSEQLLGCPVDEARKHIESLWADGMTWDNHGEWHIDHIRPCASFDFTDPEQQRECFHYTNLQPLWAKDNLQKGDKY